MVLSMSANAVLSLLPSAGAEVLLGHCLTLLKFTKTLPQADKAPPLY